MNYTFICYIFFLFKAAFIKLRISLLQLKQNVLECMHFQRMLAFLTVFTGRKHLSMLLLDVRYANIQNLLIFDGIKVCQTAIKAYTQQRPNNNTTVFHPPPRFSGFSGPYPSLQSLPWVTPGV